MAATTLGFIPLQLIPTNAIGQYSFDKGFPANGTYVVVKTPTVAQQLQLTKSLKEMQNGTKEINNNENANNKPLLLRCKRRVDFTGLGCKLVDSQQTPSVSRRNERERKRVKMVNLGFETLRQHVPVGRKNKKMSKVETLRSAVQYIKQLQEMLESHDNAVDDLLPGNMVDMDELENKVTEIIQNDSNNAAEMENRLDINSQDSGNANIPQNLGGRLDLPPVGYYSEQNSCTPQCSPDLPESPENTQGQYFQSFTNCDPVYTTTQYDALSSSSLTSSHSMTSYSQASPAGSLHSPTSSVVSDSSYDSVGQEEEDILSFSNWF